MAISGLVQMAANRQIHLSADNGHRADPEFHFVHAVRTFELSRVEPNGESGADVMRGLAPTARQTAPSRRAGRSTVLV